MDIDEQCKEIYNSLPSPVSLGPSFNLKAIDFDKDIDSQLFFQFMAHDDSVLETFYQGKGQSEIKQKRQFFMKLFEDESYGVVALFHLIEMGNINQQMVERIMSYVDRL
jgi:hypothetical protein